MARKSKLQAFLENVTGRLTTKQGLIGLVDAAKLYDVAIPHLVMNTLPGSENVKLASLIALSLDVSYQFVQAEDLDRPADLLPYLTNLEDRSLLVINQLESLSPEICDFLAAPLEAFRIDVTLGDGIASRTVSMLLKKFTLIGIVSDFSTVSKTLSRWMTVCDFNDDENTKSLAIKDAKEELDQLIGLPGVKDEVRRLINFLTVQRERKRHGLRESTQALHFVFTGNPGTGKTTVARILGRIFHGFGLLATPKVVECDRSGLVGGYLGQTAIKTDQVIQSAIDGVLFIDEAYTLAGDADKFGHGDMFGEEAINTLLKRMEDDRGKLIVIAAGYPALMKNFLRSNPGLESRFTCFISFEDYSIPDLCRIFESFCSASEYSLTPLAYANSFLLFCVAYHRRDERFGNARFVRNVYEQTVSRHSDRLMTDPDRIDKMSLTTLDSPDIPFDMVGGFNVERIEFDETTWEAQCPGCGMVSKRGINHVGQRVVCKCGQKFIFPWWTLLAESTDAFIASILPSLTPADKIGFAPADNSSE